jgi:hypothetical protein
MWGKSSYPTQDWQAGKQQCVKVGNRKGVKMIPALLAPPYVVMALDY